jgi:hypothetical protein
MASVRIFEDIEEALSREVRRITYHDARTVDKTVLRETFDPFSGEVVTVPLEAEFYDSSADAGVVQYPHFFIRLMKSGEDRATGRIVPEYGKWMQEPVATSPKAFQIVLGGSGLISAPGNELTTSAFQIRKVQTGYLLRLLEGNNKGTYTVISITVSNTGDHSIFVSSTLVQNLPAFIFDTAARTLVFQGATDLNTVLAGDTFVDASSTSFPITSIDVNAGKLVIGGIGTPDSSDGSSITRSGNVFQNTDLSQVRYMVMDPTKPIQAVLICGEDNGSTSSQGVSPPIPMDAYYMIRIDSKTRENHRDVLNRVWEEFNPPRTALPVIVRSRLSADEELTADVTTGGATTIQVADNSNFNIGDPVFIFDDLTPTKRPDGLGFQRPFESTVVNKISTDQIVLKDTVPDSYKISNTARIVSYAEFNLYMFNLEDHVTKDVEGSQYWVHEFTFWVQFWIDRLETPSDTGVVTEIQTPIEDIDTGNIISNK